MHTHTTDQAHPEHAEALYWEALYRFSEKGYSARINGCLLCALPGTDILAYNRVLGISGIEQIDSQFLEKVSAWYTEKGVPRAMMQIPPQVLSEEMLHTLGQCGFKPHNAWAKLAMDIDSYHFSEKDEIVQVTSETATLYADLVCQSFGWPTSVGALLSASVGSPGYTHYIGYRDGQPAAGAALYTWRDQACMAMAATLEGYRSRGLQKDLLHTRLAKAKQLGCRIALTETGAHSEEKPNLSYLNMRKVGFDLLYERPNFVWSQEGLR